MVLNDIARSCSSFGNSHLVGCKESFSATQLQVSNPTVIDPGASDLQQLILCEVHDMSYKGCIIKIKREVDPIVGHA